MTKASIQRLLRHCQLHSSSTGTPPKRAIVWCNCRSCIYRMNSAPTLAAFEDDEYEDVEESDQDKEEEEEEEEEEGWEDDDEEYEEYYHGSRAGRQPQGCPTQ